MWSKAATSAFPHRLRPTRSDHHIYPFLTDICTVTSRTESSPGAERGAQFDRRQFNVRIAMVIGMAVAAALVPSVGDKRVVIVAVLLAIVLPSHYLVRRVVGVPNPAGWLDLLALATAATVAAIEPTVWPAAILFQMLNTGGAVAFLPGRWTLTLGVFSLSSMTLVALLRDVSGAVPMLAVGGLYLPALVVGARQKLDREQRSTQRVDSVLGSLPLILWEADARSGQVLSVVGHCGDFLGITADELMDEGFHSRVHPEDQMRFQDRLARHSATFQLSYRFRHGDGTWIWLRDRVERATSTNGPVLRGVTIDITSSRINELRLERQQEIVRHMSAMVIVLARPELGLDSPILSISNAPAWLDTPDLRDPSASLRRALPHLAENAEIASAFAEFDGGLDSAVIESIGVESAGEVRYIDLEVFGLPDGTGVVLIEDVSTRERSNALVRFQASHDALTNLPNRMEMMAAVRAALETGRPLALLMIDLNRFKDINDTLGHLTGDELLKIMSKRLAAIVTGRHVVARLGGDEFAVLLNDVDQHEIETIVDRISTSCRETAVIGNAMIGSSASIGVALAPRHATEAETLFQYADIAMYESKRARVTHRFYDRSLASSGDQLDLVADLPTAIERRQFMPFFQPKISLNDDRAIGAEALIRWAHPTRGMLTPVNFLDVVGIAGLLDELAQQALEQTLDLAAQATPDLQFAVNLSAVNLRQLDLAERIETELAMRGLGAERLMVELTESEVIDHTGVLHRTLGEIAELGVSIAIDDFGTGYSSFSHLRSLPLSELKIDQQFVNGMMHNRSDAVIVRSMIDLGHNLGVSVCAEGVEDQATLNRLRELGCDVAQGYWFGRPMPQNRILDWMAARRTHERSTADD